MLRTCTARTYIWCRRCSAPYLSYTRTRHACTTLLLLQHTVIATLSPGALQALLLLAAAVLHYATSSTSHSSCQHAAYAAPNAFAAAAALSPRLSASSLSARAAAILCIAAAACVGCCLQRRQPQRCVAVQLACARSLLSVYLVKSCCCCCCCLLILWLWGHLGIQHAGHPVPGVREAPLILC